MEHVRVVTLAGFHTFLFTRLPIITAVELPQQSEQCLSGNQEEASEGLLALSRETMAMEASDR